MEFEAVLKYLVESFRKSRIDFALIGGFALGAAGYTRTTQDIDLLILVESLPKVKKILNDFGYELVYQSEDVAHFQGKMKQLGAVDLLLAHRKYAKNMLKRARECEILNKSLTVKIISPEDLIGLKVQASSNDSKRYSQDMADIEVILRASRGDLNMPLVREYFELFQREKELDEILERIEDVK